MALTYNQNGVYHSMLMPITNLFCKIVVAIKQVITVECLFLQQENNSYLGHIDIFDTVLISLAQIIDSQWRELRFYIKLRNPSTNEATVC